MSALLALMTAGKLGKLLFSAGSMLLSGSSAFRCWRLCFSGGQIRC